MTTTPVIRGAGLLRRSSAVLPLGAALWAGRVLGSLSHRLSSSDSPASEAAVFRTAGESVAAVELARRLDPAALCRRLRLDGWEHLKAAEAEGRGVVLLAAPYALGAFALLPIGLYRGRVEILAPAKERRDLILCQPEKGFGLHLLQGEPAAVLAASGRLGAIFDLADPRPFEIAARSGAPLLPLIACYRDKVYRLKILSPLPVASASDALPQKVGERLEVAFRTFL